MVEPFRQRLSAALTILESGGNSKTLAQLDAICKKLGIAVTVIDGMAVAAHGYPRFTADIDLLIKRPDAHKLANALLQFGWTNLGQNKLQHSSGIILNLCAEGVRAGKTTFPAPTNINPGVAIADLPTLLMLKVKANRHKDRSDIIELIKANKLTKAQLMAIAAAFPTMDKQLMSQLWHTAMTEMIQ